jgi:hypothetical protein
VLCSDTLCLLPNYSWSTSNLRTGKVKTHVSSSSSATQLIVSLSRKLHLVSCHWSFSFPIEAQRSALITYSFIPSPFPFSTYSNWATVSALISRPIELAVQWYRWTPDILGGVLAFGLWPREKAYIRATDTLTSPMLLAEFSARTQSDSGAHGCTAGIRLGKFPQRGIATVFILYRWYHPVREWKSAPGKASQNELS